ncbi:MAG: hypothetical protein ABR548_14570 [Actinomycetota bacterium]|nr:hypothetical protein [Actinomycetota bacterium]
MKKISMFLAIAMLLMMVIGMVGIGHATQCAGPVATDCNSGPNDTAPHCDVFVDSGQGLPVDGTCLSQ